MEITAIKGGGEGSSDAYWQMPLKISIFFLGTLPLGTGWPSGTTCKYYLCVRTEQTLSLFRLFEMTIYFTWSLSFCDIAIEIMKTSEYLNQEWCFQCKIEWWNMKQSNRLVFQMILWAKSRVLCALGMILFFNAHQKRLKGKFKCSHIFMLDNKVVLV